MQGPSIAGIAAYVRIQTAAWWDPRSQEVIPAQIFEFDSRKQFSIADDLISVTVSKELKSPCGRFTLKFVPRQPIPGYFWSDLIPSYSLCEIWLQSHPGNPEPVLVMVGLTDGDLETANYGQKDPERVVCITGRELSCLLVDQQVFTLPAPPLKVNAEAPLNDPSVAVLEGMPALFSQQAALVGMYAIDPELAKGGDSPVAALDRFVRMITTGLTTAYNPTGLPLLNLQLPATSLEELLVFAPATVNRELAGRSDPEAPEESPATLAALFDPAARLPAASTLSGDGTPLWSLMTGYVDPAYQEFYAVSVGRSTGIGDISGGRPLGHVELRFRKKPFAGKLDKNGKLIGLAAAQGSQFDADWITENTDDVADDDVVSYSFRRSVENVQNLYYVEPMIPGINELPFRDFHQPLADAGDISPSSIRRYGPRLRNTHDYYFPDYGKSGSTVTVTTGQDVASSRATRRELLLWSWHKFEPLFQKGTITLIGRPDLQVGRRLVLSLNRASGRPKREFYVTAVTHNVQFGQRPVMRSEVRVERGWPV